MDFLQIWDVDDEAHGRAPRVFIPREFFDGDTDFVQRFRLNRTTFEDLERRIGPVLLHPTRRNLALTPTHQILTALRFYATNSFYHVVRDAHGPSEATVCQVVKRVTNAINDVLFADVVTWPAVDVERLSVDFFRLGGMPSVCSALDGTLINIKTPNDNEMQFVDRKGAHSLNVMVVCGPQHQLFYVNASWPGSVNDARVLRNSNLFDSCERQGHRFFPGCVLLGDSIYPCLQWLLPPFLRANLTAAEGRFNVAHRRTRSIVERSIGLLKIRFACLRMLRVKGPAYASEIVKACATLHNLCISIKGAIDDNAILNMEIEEPDVQHGAGNANHNEARRWQLVAFFE